MGNFRNEEYKITTIGVLSPEEIKQIGKIVQKHDLKQKFLKEIEDRKKQRQEKNIEETKESIAAIILSGSDISEDVKETLDFNDLAKERYNKIRHELNKLMREGRGKPMTDKEICDLYNKSVNKLNELSEDYNGITRELFKIDERLEKLENAIFEREYGFGEGKFDIEKEVPKKRCRCLRCAAHFAEHLNLDKLRDISFRVEYYTPDGDIWEIPGIGLGGLNDNDNAKDIANNLYMIVHLFYDNFNRRRIVFKVNSVTDKTLSTNKNMLLLNVSPVCDLGKPAGLGTVRDSFKFYVEKFYTGEKDARYGTKNIKFKLKYRNPISNFKDSDATLMEKEKNFTMNYEICR